MYKEILDKLPYSKPFLFVDALLDVTQNSVKGVYTYTPDSDFYKGHFKNNPITPGVILTETMAQIGVVCLGIYLTDDQINASPKIALTSSDIEYVKPVFPNEKVTVVSEKVYFRFGKLKCKVKMMNSQNEIVCQGTIAGMIV
jgi:3-hydroxyacyl-[acyl-carrier-protein] dehydratase